MWYQLEEITRSAKGEIRAKTHVPPTSPWFDGHFPEEPVLPGVAQIGMVHDVVARALGRELKLVSVSRIRFKRIVRPDDPLTIIVAPSKKDAAVFTFRISIRNEAVCSGVVHYAES
ncbi:MAG: hypothetical protein LJE94_09820 [Deltaproteobacteria bacterium]|nr:hypothetical protein [Deltaproteobacteria bacterium]